MYSILSLSLVLEAAAAAAVSKPTYIKTGLVRKEEFTAYLALFQVGTPLQTEYLKVDTGSPTISFLSTQNDFCEQKSKPCSLYGTFNNLTSSTSRDAGGIFADQLADFGSGTYLRDDISIGGKRLPSAYFGYLTNYPVYGFDMVQDPDQTICGLSLLAGVTSDTQDAYLLPQLRRANMIDRMSASFYLGPDEPKYNHSSLILGGYYDRAKVHGPFFSIPMVDPKTQVLSNGQTNSVNVTCVTSLIGGKFTTADYGPNGTHGVGLPVLMDTGNPNWYIPDPIFGEVHKAVGSPTDINPQTGSYDVDCKYLKSSDSNVITVYFGKHGNIKVPISRVVTDFGNGKCGSFISSGGSTLQGGFGDPFLRSTVSAFDSEGLELYLGQVKYTDAEDVVPLPSKSYL